MEPIHAGHALTDLCMMGEVSPGGSCCGWALRSRSSNSDLGHLMVTTPTSFFGFLSLCVRVHVCARACACVWCVYVCVCGDQKAPRVSFFSSWAGAMLACSAGAIYATLAEAPSPLHCRPGCFLLQQGDLHLKTTEIVGGFFFSSPSL